MKKSLFILATAALVFASCNNDVKIDENKTLEAANEITFHSLVPRVMRAMDAHFNVSGDQFKVTAFPQGTTATAYFSNVVFQGDGTTFTSTGGKYYWPNEYNLDFYAWQPANASDDYSSISVTPNAAAASQIDLVYARTNDWGKCAVQTGTPAGHHIDGSSVEGVTINFRHAESKVLIKLYNSNSNIKVTVRDAAICNVKNSGVFAFGDANTDGQNTGAGTVLSSSTWDVSEASVTSYSQTDESNSKYNVALGSAAQVGVDWILIPQSFTYATTYNNEDANKAFTAPCIKVSLKIQNTTNDAYIVGADDDPLDDDDNGGYVTAMWPLKADPTAWAMGKKYTYTVDLAGGGYYEKNNTGDMALDPILAGAEIKFVTVTVDSWTDAAPIAVNN